jgi:hypothetical protein
MRGTWGPQANICQLVCVVLVGIYLFQTNLGLNHLDFSGYTQILPVVAHYEDPSGASGDPKPIFFYFVCVVLVVI